MFITLNDVVTNNIYVIPVVPPSISIEKGGQNETINTVNGDIRLIGDESLTQISWTSIFPVYKNYGFTEFGSLNNGYSYIEFINNCIKTKIPIRVVITTRKKLPFINMLMSIDSGFSYDIDKAGDIVYSIKLTEFPPDNWDYVNFTPNYAKLLKTMAQQSAQKKALSKVGLI